MTETLFQFDECNYQRCQDGYRGERQQEYYLGNYTIDAGSIIDVRAERKAVGSCSIIRMRARTRQSFMRSWSHIREDATDVTVLWFVRRGRLSIRHQGGHSVAADGDLALTKSMSPFAIECQTDEDAVHETLHVIVPTHIFRRFVPQEVKTGFALPATGRAFGIAQRLFMELFEDSESLSEKAELVLLDSALSLVADGIGGTQACFAVRQSLRDRRLQDVLRYIDLHLSDPNLSAARVAEACDISPRYLSSLLRSNGTPFSELIWDKRVKIASRWLAESRPADVSIAEIAFRVGFKSPAHFSRMFKRVFQQGPREYRAACMEGRPTRCENGVQGRQAFTTGQTSNTLQ